MTIYNIKDVPSLIYNIYNESNRPNKKTDSMEPSSQKNQIHSKMAQLQPRDATTVDERELGDHVRKQRPANEHRNWDLTGKLRSVNAKERKPFLSLPILIDKAKHSSIKVDPDARPQLWHITLSRCMLEDEDLESVPLLVEAFLKTRPAHSRVIVNLSENGFHGKLESAVDGLKQLLSNPFVVAIIVHHTPLGTIHAKDLLLELFENPAFVKRLIWIPEKKIQRLSWRELLNGSEMAESVKASHESFYNILSSAGTESHNSAKM